MSPLQDVCGTGLCRAQPALLLLPGDGGSTSHGHKLPCSPGSILHHWCMAAVMEPWEAVAVLPRCSLQEWHRCAPGTPVLTEFVPKALRSRLFWIAAGAGSQWQFQHGHQHCHSCWPGTAPSFTLPQDSNPRTAGTWLTRLGGPAGQLTALCQQCRKGSRGTLGTTHSLDRAWSRWQNKQCWDFCFT